MRCCPPMESTCFHRIAITLRARQPIQLHFHHAATLHALVASGCPSDDGQSHCPDGVMIEAPEQGRIRVEAGETYRFGLSLLAADPARARRCVADIVDGLEKTSKTRPRRPVAFGLGRLSVHCDNR